MREGEGEIVCAASHPRVPRRTRPAATAETRPQKTCSSGKGHPRRTSAPLGAPIGARRPSGSGCFAVPVGLGPEPALVAAPSPKPRREGRARSDAPSRAGPVQSQPRGPRRSTGDGVFDGVLNQSNAGRVSRQRSLPLNARE